MSAILRAVLLVVIAALGLDAGALHAQKVAVILISPDLGNVDKLFALPRVVWEKDILSSTGYQVRVMPASREAVVQALTNPQVRAMSYFGHASGPSVEHIDAVGWKNIVYQHLLRTYLNQRMPMQQAAALATADVQNFGLERMRNHSCSSLANATLAHQFVRPGGIYSGATGSYQPCPTPWTMLMDTVQFVLDDYRVPGSLPTLPTAMNQCERGGSNICGTLTLQSPTQYAARWGNGASASLTIDRFDEAWVVMNRYDQTGTSAGLYAVYIGRRYTNNQIQGTVTWHWQGKSWSGTWNASWGQQAPTGRGGA